MAAIRTMNRKIVELKVPSSAIPSRACHSREAAVTAVASSRCSTLQRLASSFGYEKHYTRGVMRTESPKDCYSERGFMREEAVVSPQAASGFLADKPGFGMTRREFVQTAARIFNGKRALEFRKVRKA
jgi:hypothetical protein